MASGRYQSRLFNFVHNQSRRLTQQCDRAFRQLQVATSAVVPILLYPIYLLFKSSSAVKLDHSGQQSWPQLPVNNTDFQPDLTADTPIQRVLQAISVPSELAVLTLQSTKPENFLAFWRFKFLSKKPKSTSNLNHPVSPTLKRPTIQGVATQLSSRTLVLVTAQNEILDIFTPQQQQKLQERIIEEITKYWRYQQLSRQQLTKRLVPTRAILSPVSLSSIIAWVQTGTVVLANNIFQQSSLVSKKEVNLPQSAGRYPHPLVFLDRTVAALESKHLAPELKVALIDTETHSSKIKTLILAAINYFFGDGFAGSRSDLRQRQPTVAATPTNTSLKLPTKATPAKALPHQRTFKLSSANQLSSVGIKPWLTLNDLFGEPELADVPANLYKSESLTQTTNQVAEKNLAPYSNQVTKYSLQNLLNRLQMSLLQPKQTSGRVVQQKMSQRKILREVRTKQLSPLPTGVNSGEVTRYRTSNTNIKPQPNWIETNATVLGYVLHPLEQLLAWLDRIMLWLEKILIRVFQRVQRLWRGK